MKETRQPIMLVDYLNGSVNPKDPQWNIFVQMIQGATSHSFLDTESTKMGTMDKEIVLQFHNEQRALNVRDLVLQDKGIKTMVHGVLSYIKHKGPNYVISAPLGKALTMTKGDMDLKYFPKDFCGFVSLPDIFKKKYFGSFVFPMLIKDVPSLGVTSLCYEYNVHDSKKDIKLEGRVLTPGYHIIPVAEGSYAKAVAALDEQEGDNPHTDDVYWGALDDVDKLYYRTIMQSIVYIKNTDEELVSSLNQFSDKKKKQEGERKAYTSLPFIRVGMNFHLPKTFSIDSTVVSGHWRWQPYGIDRALVKLIYIEPHVRNFTKE